jgi:hypothetical protein
MVPPQFNTATASFSSNHNPARSFKALRFFANLRTRSSKAEGQRDFGSCSPFVYGLSGHDFPIINLLDDEASISWVEKHFYPMQ